MAETRDIIIIGAGHNGLVAAYYLAKAGLRPLVLERREVLGGGKNGRSQQRRGDNQNTEGLTSHVEAP